MKLYSDIIMWRASAIVEDSNAAIAHLHAMRHFGLDKRAIAYELLCIIDDTFGLGGILAMPHDECEPDDPPHSPIEKPRSEPEEGVELLPAIARAWAMLKWEMGCAMDHWRRDLDDIPMSPDDDAAEIFIEDLIRDLKNIQAVAQTIFDGASAGLIVGPVFQFRSHDLN